MPYCTKVIPEDPVLTSEFAIKFWSKVLIRDPNDCWEWIGGMSSKGYGRIYINGSIFPAHRVSFFMHKNGQLLQNFVVCHSCDHPWCVNPDHLWEGTNRTNTADAMSKRYVSR